MASDGQLMAAEIINKDSILEVGMVWPLFRTDPLRKGRSFDAAPDGQRFLVNTSLEEKMSPPLTLVVNWMAGLKQ